MQTNKKRRLCVNHLNHINHHIISITGWASSSTLRRGSSSSLTCTVKSWRLALYIRQLAALRQQPQGLESAALTPQLHTTHNWSPTTASQWQLQCVFVCKIMQMMLLEQTPNATSFDPLTISGFRSEILAMLKVSYLFHSTVRPHSSILHSYIAFLHVFSHITCVQRFLTFGQVLIIW